MSHSGTLYLYQKNRSPRAPRQYSTTVRKFKRRSPLPGVSRRRVGQRCLRLGGGTHILLIGHVLKSDPTGIAGRSMSELLRFCLWVFLVFVCPWPARAEGEKQKEEAA